MNEAVVGSTRESVSICESRPTPFHVSSNSGKHSQCFSDGLLRSSSLLRKNNGLLFLSRPATKPLFRANGFPGNGLVIDLAMGITSRSIVTTKNGGVRGERTCSKRGRSLLRRFYLRGPWFCS